MFIYNLITFELAVGYTGTCSTCIHRQKFTLEGNIIIANCFHPFYHQRQNTICIHLDNMLKFPAAERNKEVVLNVLKDHLPTDKAGLQALEVASGSGTHVALFAQHFSKIIWHPSEIDQQCLQRFPIIFIFDICHSITLKQKPRYHFDLKFK